MTRSEIRKAAEGKLRTRAVASMHRPVGSVDVVENTRDALRQAFDVMVSEYKALNQTYGNYDIKTLTRLQGIFMSKLERLDEFLALCEFQDFREWAIDTRVPNLPALFPADIAKLVSAYLEDVPPEIIYDTWVVEKGDLE